MRTILSLFALTCMVSTATASESVPADHVFGLPTGTCFDSMERVGHDLDGYKMRVLAVQQQAGPLNTTSFHSTISFSQPLSLAVVRDMVHNYHIVPLLVFSHSREPGGKTVTTLARVTRDNIEDALTAVDPTRNHHGPVFQGIVSIVGTVPTQVLTFLQQDPQVYLVDITGDRQVTKAQACDGYVNPVVWQLYGLTQ